LANEAARALKTRIESLEKEVKDLRAALILWSNDTKLAPEENYEAFNGVSNVGKKLPGQNAPLANPLQCEKGHYMVGMYIERVASGFNWARLICRKLNVPQ
jgi:hypothetical protein